ncbi:MAG: caspase family protein [Gammaproteobacteria bacterium]|nr:caspase family protein [Gammaproteobacteria bacterium]
MRNRVGWAIGMLAVVAVLCSGQGWASSRVALVVGNGAYTAGNIPALANPVNDAKLMADALKTSGFEVQLVTDADQAAMKASIKAFGERLEQAGGESVGLFYYAGHGVEAKGHNYLIPIGAEIARELEFRSDAVPADWVMSWMAEAGNRLNIVILDACRNNPYEGRYRGASQGLAEMRAPTGTLIAYSAGPKQKAEDGKEGENSPYTAALAKTLVEPGLKIEEVFKRVRNSVLEVTKGRQTPWESSSLRGDFYFVAQVEEPPAPEPPTVAVTETVSPELTVRQLAARAYEAAERIHTISSYRLVIEQFPGTLYAGLAEQQVEKLTSATAAATPSPEETEASLDLDRAKRKRTQIGLREMGFDPGSPDGHFGPNSRKAISAWQRKNRHAETGYLTEDQASTILTATPPTALLDPKCAELPGQYLGDNHAECWEEIENRAGCFLWRTHYHSDQTTKWTGQCPGGIAHGHGTYSVSAGSDHSAYEGTGTLNEGKKASGRWIEEWADGDRYEGEYRDGKRHGHGTLTWEGTEEYAGRQGRYDGEFRDGEFHGRGTLVWPSGSRYDGEFRGGRRNGKGTCTSAPVEVIGAITVVRRRYTGDWRDGKAHGRGSILRLIWTETSSQRDRFEGAFRDGEPHGRGTETRTAMTRTAIHFDDTEDWTSYDGKWGIVYEGEFHHGRAHGRWTIYDNGRPYDVEWRNGDLYTKTRDLPSEWKTRIHQYSEGPEPFLFPYHYVC